MNESEYWESGTNVPVKLCARIETTTTGSWFWKKYIVKAKTELKKQAGGQPLVNLDNGDGEPYIAYDLWVVTNYDINGNYLGSCVWHKLVDGRAKSSGTAIMDHQYTRCSGYGRGTLVSRANSYLMMSPPTVTAEEY